MLFLVGNKSDCDGREVPAESIAEFQKMNNILYSTETSAKTGHNIETLFTDCAKFIYNSYKDRLHELKGNIDNSEDYSDTESVDENGAKKGSFIDSKGHKAGRLNGRRKPTKSK